MTLRYLTIVVLVFVLAATASCGQPTVAPAAQVAKPVQVTPSPQATTVSKENSAPAPAAQATGVPETGAVPAPTPEPSGIEVSQVTADQLEALRALRGHVPGVAGLTFVADGDHLATVSGNFSLRLWDVANGQETREPSGHGSRVYTVAFSPDGRLMATEGPQNTIKLWDVESGQEVETFSGHATPVMSLTFSPDSALLASASDDLLIKLWDVESSQEVETLSGHVTPVISLAFSPDGAILASGSVKFSNIIKLWDVKSGKCLSTLTGHSDNVHNLTFSPDGTLLASASRDRTIKLWDIKTGEAMHTFTRQAAPASGLAFSPDGQVFAASGGKGEIKLRNPHSGAELVTLDAHNDYVSSIVFSPNGSFLASSGIDDTVIVWGIPRAGTSAGEHIPPQATPVADASPIDKAEFALASSGGPSGKIAFSSYREGESKIYTMNADGSEITRLSTTRLRDTRPAWSPDGSRIAYARRMSFSNHEIYVMNADGSNATRLTTNSGSVESEPTWSPDGSRLAFISNQSLSANTFVSRFNVFVISVPPGTSAAEPVLLTDIGGSNSSPDWSPDGQKIAFDSTRDGNYEIYVISADGSNPINLSNHPAHDTSPAWSPDGSRIAFVSDRDGNQEIYVMNTDGSEQVRLTDRFGFDKAPTWSPDGQYIVYYSRHEANNTEVYRMRADGSEQVRLTHEADFDGFPSWQPNFSALAAQSAAADPTATPEPTAEAPPPKRPSPSELAASLTGLPLDQFFEESWRELMLRNPEFVLAEGLADVYNLKGAELTDISDAYVRETQAVQAIILDLLREYDREALTPEQQISYDVYAWYLDDQVRRSEFLYYDYPATFFPVTAVHEEVIYFFTDLHPIANKQDAQDYVARLGKVDTKFEQLLERLKLGEEAGIVPPKFAIQWALYGVGQTASTPARYTPFYQTLEEKLSALQDMDAAEKEALLALTEKIIEQSVLPAFQALESYLQHQQSVAATKDGLWQFSQGEAYYEYILRHHTTADLTADEIYALGLQELERVHAEMRAIFDQLGYPADESLPKLFDRVAQDGGYVSGSEVIETYESIIEQADQNLDAAFDIRPQAEVIVVKSPIRGMYVSASMDGSRPGAFHAGPGDSREEFYAMPTLAYHEAVPGHHFQIALAQESDLPSFRNSLGFLGYTEGWALYAEQLAWELGWYEDDPYGNLGRLQAEAFRAARLVVDTGLHAKGWSFDQAQKFFVENVGFESGDHVNPQIEIARYIVWPGQATAYKIGMIEILKLRQRAMDQLGDQFDLKEFHNVVLSNGSMPLAILEQVVDNYIRAELSQ